MPMPGMAPAQDAPPMKAPPVAPGPTAPASVAPDQQGMKMRGLIVTALAAKYLEKAVQMLGSASEEGRDVLKALDSLTKVTGRVADALTQQEVKLSAELASPITPGSSDQQNQIRQRLGGMGMTQPAGTAA